LERRSIIRLPALKSLPVLLTALLVAQAYAMDARYVDKDGDLVADTPVAAEQIDPATLVFAYTPVEDPSVYAKVWDGFIQHLSKVTGRKVQFFPVQSNAAQIEAMRAGRIGLSTARATVSRPGTGFEPRANPRFPARVAGSP
jgi:phosphonate transport system substrate-binding protein